MSNDQLVLQFVMETITMWGTKRLFKSFGQAFRIWTISCLVAEAKVLKESSRWHKNCNVKLKSKLEPIAVKWERNVRFQAHIGQVFLKSEQRSSKFGKFELPTFSKAEVSAQVVNLLQLSKNLRFDAYLDLPVAIVMAKNDAKNPNQLSKVQKEQEQFLKLE